jgi:hypothetical protein
MSVCASSRPTALSPSALARVAADAAWLVAEARPAAARLYRFNPARRMLKRRPDSAA